MDAKQLVKNKSFCVLPWTGFQLDPNGDVKNCIISEEKLGNIHVNDIQDIMSNAKNRKLKEDMINDRKPYNCKGCYLQDANRKNLSSISSRLYYNRELAEPFLNSSKEFSLHHVDLRWTNHCNHACIYCGPLYSSKWATELGQPVKSDKQARDQVKKFVFNNVEQLKNVYLAGGEPLLLNENRAFLKLLLEKNPDVTIRVNTNLSSTGTGVFQLLCQFKNVHWTISVESIEEEYEYIRYYASWNDFLRNLKYIQTLNHKISFNMLYFILNYKSLFNCVDLLQKAGFHENSFIIGPLYDPPHLNILNLPNTILNEIKDILKNKIENSGWYLKNSYENILEYITVTPWKKDIKRFKDRSELMDKRRKQDWQITFPKLFKELNDFKTLE